MNAKKKGITAATVPKMEEANWDRTANPSGPDHDS